MTTTAEKRLYTPDELLTLPDGSRYELIHGRLVERNMGTMSSWLATRISFLIGMFLDEHALGYVLASETSFTCFPDDPRHSPRPDVAFIRFGRLANEELPAGHCKIAPDLVVEVVSPNDTAESLAEKVADFQSVGVRLIWVVYPSTRRVLIHRLPSTAAGRVSELTESDVLDGEDVLPGFACPVSEVFRLPKPRT